MSSRSRSPNRTRAGGSSYETERSKMRSKKLSKLRGDKLDHYSKYDRDRLPTEDERENQETMERLSIFNGDSKTGRYRYEAIPKRHMRKSKKKTTRSQYASKKLKTTKKNMKRKTLSQHAKRVRRKM